MLDFSNYPVIDNHCHGIYLNQSFPDVNQWRRLFTESDSQEMPSRHVSSTLFYQRFIRSLANLYQVEDADVAVLEFRNRRSPEELMQTSLTRAGLSAVLVDQGYPPKSQLALDTVFTQAAGISPYPLLRLEPLMEQIVSTHSTLESMYDAWHAALTDLREQGYYGLKSIAAYRTGLDIRYWHDDDVSASFSDAREVVERSGSVRIAHRPLLESLLWIAFDYANKAELPVQFHIGYGDADGDLRLGNPLHLRSVLEQEALKRMPVILLHECWPFTREGAYMAAVYGNAYLDLSYGIPFLGFQEMLSFTKAAVDVAPISKLLYSSDAVGIPEMYWHSAVTAKDILARVLSDAVVSGDLTTIAAETAGRAILADNARKLYGL